MKVVAEPIRASELALAETENALAILRIFESRIYHPTASSFLRPLGRVHLQRSETLTICNDTLVNITSEEDEPYALFSLDEGALKVLEDFGIVRLHHLFAKEERTDFEVDLLRSIWTFSKSSLQKTPEDRLMYVFRSLDSFLLKGSSEQIQQNVAERIAFTISGEPNSRRDIVRTVVTAYKLRSKVVHYDHEIQDLELLEKFLKITWRFFLLLIAKSGDYDSRQDFFESIDALKFS